MDEHQIFRFGLFVLDTRAFELRKEGQVVSVEPQVFDVLAYLVRHHQRVVTKQELFDHVWQDSFVGEAALSTRIMEARRAVGDSGSEQHMIRTVRSRGFRFVGPLNGNSGETSGSTEVIGANSSSASIDSSKESMGEPSNPNSPRIGRERELTALTDRLNRAATGSGSIMMIGGEAGVGKTRLIEELAEIATGRQHHVAKGACFEGDGSPPYWLWVQVMRSLLNEPAFADLHRSGSKNSEPGDFVELLQSHGLTNPEQSSDDPGPARFQLFDSIAQFIMKAAQIKPIVIILDDLHWADRETLDLFTFVARIVPSARILIVGGFRDPEMMGRNPLSEYLGSLASSPGILRISLGGLNRDEVVRLIRSVGDTVLPSALLQEIFERTQGNPFFVQEIGRDLNRQYEDHGDGLETRDIRVPVGVREAIAARMSQVSDDCKLALRTAAVIGYEFDFDLLGASTTELPKNRLLLALDEAISAHFVSNHLDVAAQFRFRHALVQQTLLEGLTAIQRIQIHERIVSAIEVLHERNLVKYSTELAYHAAQGEPVVDKSKVVSYSIMAGENSSQTYAWDKARRYFSTALSAVQDDSNPLETATILFGLGNAELRVLNYPEVQAGWDKIKVAFGIFEEEGETQSAVRAALGAQGLTPFWVHSTVDVFLRALELAEPNSIEEGYLLRLYAAATRYEQENATGSLQALEKALDIATNHEDKQLEIGVLAELSMASLVTGDFHEATEVSEKAIRTARAAGFPFDERYAHFVGAAASAASGAPEQALQHARNEQALESQIGSILGGAWNEFHVAYANGDRRGIARLREVLDDDYPTDYVVRLFSALGAWTIGEEVDLESRISAAQQDGNSAHLLFQRASSAAFLALAAQSLGSAELARSAGRMGDLLLQEKQLTPHVNSYATFASGLAAVGTGSKQLARKYYEMHEPRTSTMVSFHLPFMRDRFLGLLSQVEGHINRAVRHFETAAESATRLGYQLEHAWICHDLTKALIASGDEENRAKAALLLSDSINSTHELGLVQIEKRLKSLSALTDSA